MLVAMALKLPNGNGIAISTSKEKWSVNKKKQLFSNFPAHYSRSCIEIQKIGFK